MHADDAERARSDVADHAPVLDFHHTDDSGRHDADRARCHDPHDAQPGDDNGGAVPPVPSVPAGTQAFSSVGGSIVVAVHGSSLSLVSSSPAVGFEAEVHENGPSRVEVRFFGTGTNGDTEWRIRIELGAGGITSEVTRHG
jgi:hypothetical protein